MQILRNINEFQWKARETYENKPRGGGGSYHAAHANRHLENHCDEEDSNSIQEHLIEKKEKKKN